jgi:hypothetical protein
MREIALVVVLGVLIQPPAAKSYLAAFKAARAFCTTRSGICASALRRVT